jgi:LPS export ABC transporter protein LptC
MDKLNKIRRFLAVVAVLATVLVAATIAYRIHRESPGKKPERKLPLQVDVSLQKVHFTETREGAKRWDLSADRAEYNRQSDTTSLTGVKLLVEGAPSVGELQVTADRADYNNASRDVVLNGNVRGVTGKGMTFSTTRVNYLAAKSQLQTAERVRLTDAGLELEGVGMEFQTQTRKFKLLKDVSAVYRPQGGR